MKLQSTSALDALSFKSVALLGMSGVGKTRLSNILRGNGDWYHYSVDYRLGSTYLAEHINDDLRRRAMRDPVLADLLRTDSVKVAARIGIDNLSAMSAYLGTPGDPSRGGLNRLEFLRRQEVHERAEKSAMYDLADFQRRAREVFGYHNIVCDTSGSLCGIVDPEDPEDPILTDLAERCIILVIEGSEADEAALIDRFRADPKPIFYSEPVFNSFESEYKMPDEGWKGVAPDAFRNWAFPRLIQKRASRYSQIAHNWGYKVASPEVARINNGTDFDALLRQTVSKAITE